MLARSVATIVNQVQAMKTLVNEFRDYARLPAAQMKALDLNALVSEVLALYGTAQDAGGCTPSSAPSCRTSSATHAAAPGDPQPRAERARRGGRPADGSVRVHTEVARGTGRATCAPCACR